MKSEVNAAGQKLSKQLGIGSLIAAAVFLFNPCINIIDILPDFFGYLLLIKGLQKWADLCPGMNDAIQALGKLRWFMLLKMLFMALVPLVDDTFVLIFTFGFALIEYIYLIPALGRIFDGFEYFATRFGGRAVYVNYKNVRTVTYIFFWAKGLFSVLPELCSLSDYEYSGYVTSGVQFNFASYKSALLIVSLFLTTLTGIMWLVNIIPYFRRIGRETEFLKRVYAQYELEIGSDTGLKLRRGIHSVLMLLIAGFVFFLNIWFDEINVIPNFIGGIFMICAMVKLSKFTAGSKPAVRVCAAFTAVSLISYAVSAIFSVFYGLRSIERDFFAYDFYNVSRILSILEYVLMFAAIFMVIRELRKLIMMHLGPDPDTTDRRLIDIYTSQQHELDRRFVAGLIAFVIVVILNIVYLVLRADINTDAPGFWLVPFLATGIWWIYMRSAFDQLFNQIEYKYL